MGGLNLLGGGLNGNWGRTQMICTSGQAVFNFDVISQLCFEEQAIIDAPNSQEPPESWDSLGTCDWPFRRPVREDGGTAGPRNEKNSKTETRLPDSAEGTQNTEEPSSRFCGDFSGPQALGEGPGSGRRKRPAFQHSWKRGSCCRYEALFLGPTSGRY